MKLDPLAIAIREINHTRHLLEKLIISSESFDYPKAKVAIAELERKARDLAKVQARLQPGVPANPKIHVLDFSKSAAQAQS